MNVPSWGKGNSEAACCSTDKSGSTSASILAQQRAASMARGSRRREHNNDPNWGFRPWVVPRPPSHFISCPATFGFYSEEEAVSPGEENEALQSLIVSSFFFFSALLFNFFLLLKMLRLELGWGHVVRKNVFHFLRKHPGAACLVDKG